MSFLKRFPRAWHNLGPFQAITIFVLLAYMVFLAISFALDGFYLGVILAAVGIILPRLVLTQMIDHSERVTRALNILWLVVIAILVLEWTHVITFNIIIAIAFLFLGPFYIAARFWLISDLRVYTARGVRHVIFDLADHAPDDESEFDDRSPDFRDPRIAAHDPHPARAP